MKLLEIFAAVRNPTKTRHTYHDFLQKTKEEDKELLHIGIGSYANVYGKPGSNIVKKIVRLGENTNDPLKDPYIAFARYCIRMAKHNPFLPRIYDVKVYDSEDPEPHRRYYAVVVLERLIPYTDLPNNAETVIDGEFIKHFDQLMRYDWDDPAGDSGHPQDVGFAHAHKHITKLTKNVNLATALRIVTSINKQGRGRPDLHQENLMWRRDGNTYQLVLTDPVF